MTIHKMTPQQHAEHQYAEAIARTLVMVAEGLAHTGMRPDQAANVIAAAADRAVKMFCKQHGIIKTPIQ